MRIIVLGAGAIGSVYGARLSKFHDVTLIGGASHVAAIQRDGLVMQGHVSGTLRLPAFTTVPSIQPGTLILLTTKVNNNVAAVRPIVDLLPDNVTIVCVQNGLYSEDLVKDLVGDRALVLRAITQVGGILVKPGVVDNTVAGYTLLESHAQSPAIAAVLTEAGLDGRIIPDIKKEMWRKAIFNCVINPTTSLLGSEVGAIVDPQLNSLKQQIIDECVAVAESRWRDVRRRLRRGDRPPLCRRPHDRVDAPGPDEGTQDRDRSHERRRGRPWREIRHPLPGQCRPGDDDSLSGNEVTRLFLHAGH